MPLGLSLTYRVKQIVVLTIGASIAGAIASAWMGLPVSAWVGLTPSAIVGAGEGLPGVPAIWQVATYPFFAWSPLDLVLGALAYGWFAGDLERAWGSRLFLDRFVLFVLGVAAAHLLAALLYPGMRDSTLIGPSPVLEGLVIAWGTTFPDRTIRIWMIIPITGRTMVWLTAGLLALSVVYGGPTVIPWLAAPIAAVGLGIAFGRTALSLRWLALHAQKWRVTRELDRSRSDRTLH